ncbi:glycosyltransferase family 39 protein, partial [Brunnivagina elsteri]
MPNPQSPIPNKHLHYLSLIIVIILGAILRFGNLDFKPLWMDEIITTIFSLGKNYQDLPLDKIFSLTKLTDIFTYKPGISCSQIAGNIASQSTHPPLFFCGMYIWLGWLQSVDMDWIWKVRSLPALFGVAGIFVIYWVNRIAFSPQAGIAAAACMAVSPFAVYLSQEARHYTLPMLLVSLALLGLIQIQKDIFQSQKIKFRVWFFWVVINSFALYVHYFCILALIAQIATITILLFGQRRKIQLLKKACLALTLSTSGILISYLPWLMIMFSHSNRSETDWLQVPQHIAPFYQTLINWVLMVIVLPVEKQPIINVVVSAILMIVCGVWIGREFLQGLKKLLIQEETKFATFTLLSFTVWIIIEFFAIIYFLKKDITVVPRYNFIYYPSFCALLTASLLSRKKEIIDNRNSKSNYSLKKNRFLILKSPLFIILIMGIISCLFLLLNLVFQKPFQPEIFAKNLNQEPSIPTMVVVAYS